MAEATSIPVYTGPNRLDRSRCDTILELFDDDKPLEVEIGSGKGKFLMHRAMALPEHNFIGFDQIWKYLKIGYRRAQKRGITNLQYFKATADEIIGHMTPSESVTTFHIYFPDPWPKRRHHKRRLLTSAFIDLLYDRLRSGGLLELATDDAEYYDWLKGTMAEAKAKWSATHASVNERIMNPEIKTNFELKYEADNRDLHYLELRKP